MNEWIEVECVLVYNIYKKVSREIIILSVWVTEAGKVGIPVIFPLVCTQTQLINMINSVILFETIATACFWKRLNRETQI